MGRTGILGVCIVIAAVIAISACEDAMVDVDAYGSIEGTVLSDSTGEPVSQASVTTTPATEAIVTDNDGQFFLEDIPAGDYSITIRKSGFERSNVNVAVRGHEISRATILLAEEGQTDYYSPDTRADVDITNWWNVVENDTTVYAHVEYRIKNTGDTDLADYEITFRIFTPLGSFYHNEEGGKLEKGRSKTDEFEKYIRHEKAERVEVFDVWYKKAEEPDE